MRRSWVRFPPSQLGERAIHNGGVAQQAEQLSIPQFCLKDGPAGIGYQLLIDGCGFESHHVRQRAVGLTGRQWVCNPQIQVQLLYGPQYGRVA